MAGGKTAAVKKKRKNEKNKSSSQQESKAFFSVLVSNENRDRPWAITLKTVALKKSLLSLFNKIHEELRLELEGSECRGDCALYVVEGSHFFLKQGNQACYCQAPFFQNRLFVRPDMNL